MESTMLTRVQYTIVSQLWTLVLGFLVWRHAHAPVTNSVEVTGAEQYESHPACGSIHFARTPFNPSETKNFERAEDSTMRKVINSTYITLDGVIEGPHLWPSLGRPSDERGQQIQTDLLLACDAVLMGRRTYQGFAPVWSTRSGDPYSDHINVMPKYVVSTTLTDPQWQNTHVIGDDPVAAISRLKETPGKDIVQYGFGDVSRLLLQNGLLDELRLWVHPLILGRGISSDLLFGASPSVSFNLVGSTTLSNAIIILNYELDKALV
jgi:dihydrofolate reductase